MQKLLVASNQKLWRDRIKALLIPYGFCLCGEAKSLDETLLLSELKIPDIILFNFKCSLRDQLDFISNISQLGDSVKILVSSENPIRRSTWSYIHAGACAIIQPTTTDDELISIVRGALAGFTMAPVNRLAESRPKATPPR